MVEYRIQVYIPLHSSVRIERHLYVVVPWCYPVVRF